MSNICQFSCTIAQNLSSPVWGSICPSMCVCVGVCGVWSSTATLAKSRRAATSLPRRHTPQSRTHISVTLTRMHNTRKHTHTPTCADTPRAGANNWLLSIVALIVVVVVVCPNHATTTTSMSMLPAPVFIVLAAVVVVVAGWLAGWLTGWLTALAAAK